MQNQTIKEFEHRPFKFNSSLNKARFKLRKQTAAKNQSIQIKVKDLKFGQIDLRAESLSEKPENLRLLIKQYLESFQNEGISTLVNTDNEIECLKAVFQRILDYNDNQEYTIYSGDWESSISAIASVDTFELVNVRSAVDEVYGLNYDLFVSYFIKTKDYKLAIQLLEKINEVIGENDIVNMFSDFDEEDEGEKDYWAIPEIKKSSIKDSDFLKKVKKSDFSEDFKNAIHKFIETKDAICFDSYSLSNCERHTCPSDLFLISSDEMIRVVCQHFGEIAGNYETYSLWEGKVKTAYGEQEVNYFSVQPLMDVFSAIYKTMNNE